MDKKLKKRIESQLVITMQGILSRIHPSASADAKKKIKEAGKMVAKKFAKSVASAGNKKENGTASRKVAKKISGGSILKLKRDNNGRFQKKK